jgi:tight adherence protein C
MILQAMIAGALVGTGVLLAARSFVAPPVANLQRELAALYEPPPTEAFDAVRARWQSWALRALSIFGIDETALRQDLAAAGITIERHAAVKLGFATGAAATPLVMALAWQTVGLSIPASLVLLASGAFGLAGFVLPDRQLARLAAARRREFRHALGLFLELVVIVLAGGGGVETALHDAADAGSGWGFVELRQALNAARLERRSPWRSLARLADRIGSADLRELASSVELAGTSGARVRESLQAKAASVRDHELSESEGEALAASERLGGPMIGMFLGMILLIGYPAVASMLAL